VFDRRNPLFKLAAGQSVEAIIYKDLTFDSINYLEDSIYPLLFHAGYLKIVGYKGKEAILSLVNKEVNEIFARAFLKTLNSLHFSLSSTQSFIDGLLTLDESKMEDALNDIIDGVVSNDYERFYQGLLVGILNSINKKLYFIETEYASGGGYADVVVKQRESLDKAYILELKVAQDKGSGLEQIGSRRYKNKLVRQGYQNIYLIEIIFDKREVKSITIANN
jgi:hypothetical protein